MTVTLAQLRLNTHDVVNAGTNYTVRGIKVPNPPVWSAATPGNYPASIAQTTAHTDGVVPAGVVNYLIDVTSAFNEAISQPGWVSGNAVGFLQISNDNFQGVWCEAATTFAAVGVRPRLILTTADSIVHNYDPPIDAGWTACGDASSIARLDSGGNYLYCNLINGVRINIGLIFPALTLPADTSTFVGTPALPGHGAFIYPK